MKPTERHVYCITTTAFPEDFLTNDDGEVLVFESTEQIVSWAEFKSLDLDHFLAHEVEVLKD